MGVVAIVYVAVKINEFIWEGIVVLLELFIDIIIICNMIVLVVIIIGVYNNLEFVNFGGFEFILVVFIFVIFWFFFILILCIFLFVLFIIIFSSYYG